MAQTVHINNQMLATLWIATVWLRKRALLSLLQTVLLGTSDTWENKNTMVTTCYQQLVHVSFLGSLIGWVELSFVYFYPSKPLSQDFKNKVNVKMLIL